MSNKKKLKFKAQIKDPAAGNPDRTLTGTDPADLERQIKGLGLSDNAYVKISPADSDAQEEHRQEWPVIEGADILAMIPEQLRSMADHVRPHVLYADVTGYACPANLLASELLAAYVPIGASVPGVSITRDGEVGEWHVPPLPFDNSGWGDGMMRTGGLQDQGEYVPPWREDIAAVMIETANQALIELHGSQYEEAAREGYAKHGRGLVLVNTIEELGQEPASATYRTRPSPGAWRRPGPEICHWPTTSSRTTPCARRAASTTPRPNTSCGSPNGTPAVALCSSLSTGSPSVTNSAVTHDRNELLRRLRDRGYVHLHCGKWEVRFKGVLIVSTPSTPGTSMGLASVMRAVKKYERKHRRQL